jgi:hypothetical protein
VHESEKRLEWLVDHIFKMVLYLLGPLNVYDVEEQTADAVNIFGFGHFIVLYFLLDES